jgi:nucleotide-binding universal stress UspA family protein
MFERIVLAVDGSEHSSKTVEAATDLASKYGSSVTVLRVREFRKGYGSDVDLDEEDETKASVDSIVEGLRAKGVSASPEIRRVGAGGVPREIVKVASDEGAGLIVMGTRGRTEWQSLLVGGVANKVLAHAGCPVLLVR